VERGCAARDKKRRRELKAVLALEDESGFSLVSPLKHTWAPRGETPIVRTSISHHDRLNIIGALLVLPSGEQFKLSIRSYWHSLTGEEVIEFLNQLLRCTSDYIILVWDNHSIHKRKIVQEFLAQHERLILYWFPTAAPELNPAEYVWTQVCEYTAGTAPHNRDELHTNVMAGISRTRCSQKRLHSCLPATRLEWI
jgi:putative transposase